MLHIHNPNSCTSDLQMFWWSFSCSSMKLAYRSCVKVMFLNTAATAYGLTAAVCAKTNTNICFATNRVVHLSDIENDDTTCLLGNYQSLRLAADWAHTFVTGCLQSAVRNTGLTAWSGHAGVTLRITVHWVSKYNLTNAAHKKIRSICFVSQQWLPLENTLRASRRKKQGIHPQHTTILTYSWRPAVRGPTLPDTAGHSGWQVHRSCRG